MAVPLAHKSPFYVDADRPFLQRDNTMSLDVVRPDDIPQGKVQYPKYEDRSLKTQDIPTAQPTYHHLKFLNKEDMSVGSTEPVHVGGRARTYYPPMDRRVRDLSLTTADIELAQPQSNKQRGNRHTDPVCPNYELPSFYKREPTPPRHNGRVTNDVSDIELCCPKKVIPDRNYVRDPNEARDIEYASANYKERVARRTTRGPGHNRTFDVSDIAGEKKLAPRNTCPLDPVYKVSTRATTSLATAFSEEKGGGHNPPVDLGPAHDEIGAVHGSRPRKLQWDNGEPQFSLLREDIAGTVPQRWVGCVPANIYDPPEVRPMISFHDPHDIPGAQVGSLKKGIDGATRRQLNPLNPRYPMLDGDIRPQPVPVMEAERGHPRGGLGSHPMLQSRMLSGSAPNLRSPAASSGGAHMRREASHGAMLGPQGGYRPSRGPSGRATPASQMYGEHPGYSSRGMTPSQSQSLSVGGGEHPGYSSRRMTPSQSQSLQVGDTIRFDDGAPMSRRSGSSVAGSMRYGR